MLRLRPTRVIPRALWRGNKRLNNKTLLVAGLIGKVVAALCCFTPILIVMASLIGLAALVGYLDFVLLPVLALFVALTVYAMWRRQARFKRYAVLSGE